MPLRCFFSTRNAQRMLAVVLHPVPERPVMGLEIVAAPGPPAREFALGFDVQIGAVEECGFGQVVQREMAFI